MPLTKISTDGVKDDAIDASKLPANSVGASELADNAVDTNAIADNAVTKAKIEKLITDLNVDQETVLHEELNNNLFKSHLDCLLGENYNIITSGE